MITKSIGYKNQYGKYKVAEKTFNDKYHYDNWYNKFISYGNKIISEETVDLGQ